MSVLNDLALVQRTAGDAHGAEQTFRAILGIQRRHAPESSEWIATSLHNLAWAIAASGRLEEAESLFRQALAINRQVLGDTSLGASFQWMELGRIQLTRGRPAEALRLLDRSLRIRTDIVDPGSPLILQVQGERARALRHLGRLGEAEVLLASIAREARALGVGGDKFRADADSQRVALRAARRVRSAPTSG